METLYFGDKIVDEFRRFSNNDTVTSSVSQTSGTKILKMSLIFEKCHHLGTVC